MTKDYIFSHIDHTLLKAFCTWEEIAALCEEAVLYKTASVCIPPCYVERVKRLYGKALTVCTVIGFPLGYSTTKAKVFEASAAVADGADEIDMVINLTDVKNGLFEQVESEISAVRAACSGRLLKVIVETCYLTREEKIHLCKIVTSAGADYIKTSTGFGTGGAAPEDIALFLEHIGEGVKIKASGGIRTRAAMEQYLEGGCERLGIGGAVKLLCEG